MGKGREDDEEDNPFGALAAATGALVAVGLLVLMLVLVEVQPAEATFPGQNGKIAYMGREGTNGYFEIYTINATGGGGRVQLTHNSTNDSNPSYSPDGKRIAYTNYDGNDEELYTMNAEGQVKFVDLIPRISGGGVGPGAGLLQNILPVQLTNNTTHDEAPSWGKLVDLMKPCPPAQQQ